MYVLRLVCCPTSHRKTVGAKPKNRVTRRQSAPPYHSAPYPTLELVTRFPRTSRTAVSPPRLADPTNLASTSVRLPSNKSRPAVTSHAIAFHCPCPRPRQTLGSKRLR